MSLRVTSPAVRSARSFVPPLKKTKHNNDVHNKEWTQLTEHLTSSQQEKINGLVHRHVTEAHIRQIVDNFTGKNSFRGKFWETRFCSDVWSLAAYEACRRKKISVDHFTTIALLAEAVREFSDKRFIRVSKKLPNGEMKSRWVSDKPLALNERSFKVFYPGEEGYHERFNLACLNTDRGKMHQKVAKLPLVDRALFEITLPTTPVNQWSSMIAAIQRTAPGLILFIEAPLDSNGVTSSRSLILLPFPLTRVYFRYLVSDIRLSLRPTLGPLAAEDIAESKMKFTQPIGISMPGAETPKVADKYRTGGASFTFHDWYHAYRSTALPWGFYVGLNRWIQKLRALPLNERRKPQFKALLSALVDAEVMISRHPTSQKFGEIFYQKKIEEALNRNGCKYAELIFRDMATYPDLWKGFFETTIQGPGEQLCFGSRYVVSALKQKIQPKKLPFNEMKKLLNLTDEFAPIYALLNDTELVYLAGQLHLHEEFYDKKLVIKRLIHYLDSDGFVSDEFLGLKSPKSFEIFKVLVQLICLPESRFNTLRKALHPLCVEATQDIYEWISSWLPLVYGASEEEFNRALLEAQFVYDHKLFKEHFFLNSDLKMFEILKKYACQTKRPLESLFHGGSLACCNVPITPPSKKAAKAVLESYKGEKELVLEFLVHRSKDGQVTILGNLTKKMKDLFCSYVKEETVSEKPFSEQIKRVFQRFWRHPDFNLDPAKDFAWT